MKKIEATKYTPEIILDEEKGIIEIKGKSYPENTFEFYNQLMEWLEEYFENPVSKTIFNIELLYLNSSTSKFLYDLFDYLEEKSEDNSIEINWIYDEENEVAEEAGEDYKEDFENLNFNLIAKE